MDGFSTEKTPVSDGKIAGVEEFPYFGSTISASGRMDADVLWRIVLASRPLRKAVFLDKNLRLETKRKVFQACILSVLPMTVNVGPHLEEKLNQFHHRCIRAYPRHH